MAWDTRYRERERSSGEERPATSYSMLGFSSTRKEHNSKHRTKSVHLDGFPFQQPVIEASRTSSSLTVEVRVTFAAPLAASSSTRVYHSSSNFTASNRQCQGLDRRIQHCCQELITRKDSAALTGGDEKQRRYSIHIRILRRDGGLFADQAFHSYQTQRLTLADTADIIIASDRIVGMWLNRHDDGFMWFPEISSTAPTDLTAQNQLLSCVPMSQFNISEQKWRSAPGYTIHLSYQSAGFWPWSSDTDRTVRIHSQQSSPLTTEHGEELFWRAIHHINAAVSPEQLNGFEGHSSENQMVRINLQISNNLGMKLGHLRRIITRDVRVPARSNHPAASEDILTALHTHIRLSVAETDAAIDRLDDFSIRMLELRGKTWSIEDAAVFRLDSSTCHSRRTIDALLTRVQAGIRDAMRGTGLAIHVIAYKRGHLILDKAVIAKERADAGRKQFGSDEEERDFFVQRLKEKIQQAIDLICKDTLSLPEEADKESIQARSSTPRLPPADLAATHDCRFAASRSVSSESASSRVFPLVPSRYPGSGAFSRITSSSTLMLGSDTEASDVEPEFAEPDEKMEGPDSARSDKLLEATVLSAFSEQSSQDDSLRIKKRRPTPPMRYEAAQDATATQAHRDDDKQSPSPESRNPSAREPAAPIPENSLSLPSFTVGLEDAKSLEIATTIPRPNADNPQRPTTSPANWSYMTPYQILRVKRPSQDWRGGQEPQPAPSGLLIRHGRTRSTTDVGLHTSMGDLSVSWRTGPAASAGSSLVLQSADVD